MTIYQHSKSVPVSVNDYRNQDVKGNQALHNLSYQTTYELWQDEEILDLSFVINLEDGAGREFYLTEDHAFINLTESELKGPLNIQTYSELSRILNQLKHKYPASCHVYALERNEFDQRRERLQTSQSIDPKLKAK